MAAALQNHLIDHAGELSELAAECGIDWSQISDLSQGVHKNPPTLSSKYNGRCTMWVEEKISAAGNVFVRISFHTRKHGGISRTWHSHAPAASKGLLLPMRNPNKAEEESRRRKESFVSYRDAFKTAPKAESFPYLRKKGIEAILSYVDIRLLTDGKALGRKNGFRPFMCFPLYNANGSYVGLQRIYEDGTKKLTTAMIEGQYRGAHAIIGDPDQSKVIYIAEGFATAASIFLATGEAVVFSISAGNLDVVTAHIRSRYEDKELIIAADNDHSKNGNTGIYKALEAAKNSSSKQGPLAVIVPPLIRDDKTDFNDIHVNFGLDALQSVLMDPRSLRTPHPNYIEYLIQMLGYAKKQEIPALVRKIAAASKVPHFISVENLLERLETALGERSDRGVLVKNIKAVVVAGLYQAQKIAAILDSSVQQNLRFFTERNEAGHLVISESSTLRILELLAKGEIVILKAPMGTGKTELVIRRAMEGATRAAHVLPRVSVVNDAAKRLKLDHYQNIDEIMAHFTEKMVVCVNSMGAPRFSSNGVNWFENLDVLCLDEASQIFAQVTLLGRMERRKQNHEALVKAMNSARSILIADADANEYLVQELRRMAPERSITLIEIEHKADEQKRWDIHFTDSLSQVRDAFIEAALAGERCLLATDNRRKGIELERALQKLMPEIRVLNIHRESSQEGLERIQRFYLDPNGESQKYDVLIYSPAITSGVSLTSEHFTRHFGLFTGVVKVNDIVQMLGRDRTAKKWLLAVSPRGLSRQMQAFDGGLESLGEQPTIFSHLKFATDQYESDARDHLIVLAINILKLKGHRVHMAIDLEQKYDKALGRLMKTISDDLTNERLERILSQAEISESEFSALKSLWMPTADEAAAITAHRIRHELCADLTEESLAFFDKGGIRKLALLETLMAEDKDLRRLDINETLTHDPSLRFHAEEKKKLLIAVLHLLKVDPDSMLGEFTHADCQKVVALFLEIPAKVNILFGGIIDPAKPPRCATKFVQRLLGLLGLSLASRKSNGHMIRFIDQAEFQSIIKHVERRAIKQRSFVKKDVSELLAA